MGNIRQALQSQHYAYVRVANVELSVTEKKNKKKKRMINDEKLMISNKTIKTKTH